MFNQLKGLCALGLVAVVSSCQLITSAYQEPSIALPASYKSDTNGKLGYPKEWWRAFQDPTLNRLQQNLLSQNLDLKAAAARRDQAFAALGMVKSERFPQANATGSIARNRSSQNNMLQGAGADYYDLYEVTGALSYEIDLWGRVAKQIESSVANAQASDATLEDVKGTLQTQLARQYFALKSIDAEADVLKAAVKSRQETLLLSKQRADGGLTSDLDASRARGELANAEAALLSLSGTRAQLENAIAVLVGKNASTFKINTEVKSARIPIIGAGLPLSLLARRPDVAVAERKLAAATARIGVAQANFFPKIKLTGLGGLSSLQAEDFLKKSSSMLALGPSVEMPLFQGKRLRSNLEQARAQQREALAHFQKATLVAFADVESALAQIHALSGEYEARKRAVEATQEAFAFSQERYNGGVDSYLSVIDSQRELLNAQRSMVQTQGLHYAAVIQLIQALGGSYAK